MTPVPTLPRDLLAQALGNPRLVTAFEQVAQAATETQEQADANVAATSALQDATFLVLSANDTLTNERIFSRGVGLSFADANGRLTVSVDDTVAQVDGGHPVRFTALGATNVILPLSGTLATRSNVETLQNKTLASPLLSGLGNYVDDAAAAAAGVQMGGVYRTGSALKVRVA